MEILTEKSFKTVNNVTISGHVSPEGTAYLRFEGLYPVQTAFRTDHPVALYPDEIEAMQALLRGETLTVTREFKVGDLVRYVEGRVTSTWREPGAAKNGALARVTKDYTSGPYLHVEWLCTRSKNQMDGGYYPECFEVVTKSDLSLNDKGLIADRALDKGRNV